MLVTIALAQAFLNLGDEPLEPEVASILQLIISSAEEYLFEATGKVFSSETNRAVLYVLVLVNHWFENRELIGKSADKVQHTLNSIKYQLEYAEEVIPDANG